MEQFYKAIYMELRKIHPDAQEPTNHELHRHMFAFFVCKIEDLMPVSANNKDFKKVVKSCRRIY